MTSFMASINVRSSPLLQRRKTPPLATLFAGGCQHQHGSTRLVYNRGPPRYQASCTRPAPANSLNLRNSLKVIRIWVLQVREYRTDPFRTNSCPSETWQLDSKPFFHLRSLLATSYQSLKNFSTAKHKQDVLFSWQTKYIKPSSSLYFSYSSDMRLPFVARGPLRLQHVKTKGCSGTFGKFGSSLTMRIQSTYLNSPTFISRGTRNFGSTWGSLERGAFWATTGTRCGYLIRILWVSASLVSKGIESGLLCAPWQATANIDSRTTWAKVPCRNHRHPARFHVEVFSLGDPHINLYKLIWHKISNGQTQKKSPTAIWRLCHRLAVLSSWRGATGGPVFSAKLRITSPWSWLHL